MEKQQQSSGPKLTRKTMFEMVVVLYYRGYSARSHGLTEALTKKHVRLQTAMASGVRWVKLDSDSTTQSWTTLVWLLSIICSNTCRQTNRLS